MALAEMLTVLSGREADHGQVWVRDVAGRWYPVDFHALSTSEGEPVVEVWNPLYVCPPKTRAYPAAEVRLADPDTAVRLRRPSRIRRPRGWS